MRGSSIRPPSPPTVEELAVAKRLPDEEPWDAGPAWCESPEAWVRRRRAQFGSVKASWIALIDDRIAESEDGQVHYHRWMTIEHARRVRAEMFRILQSQPEPTADEEPGHD